MIVPLSTLWTELRDRIDAHGPDWIIIERVWPYGVPAVAGAAAEWVHLCLPALDADAFGRISREYNTATRPWMDRVNAGEVSYREAAPAIRSARSAADAAAASVTLAALVRLAERT